MAAIKQYLSTGLLALVAALGALPPVAADAAAARSSAHKRAQAPVKAPPAARVVKAVKAVKTAAAPARVAKVARAAATPLRISKRLVSRRVSAPLSVVRIAPPRPSFGQLYGLHGTEDALELKSSVALVLDQDTNEVLFSKNAEAVLPIASLTKLMTALVVAEARLPLNELLTVSQDDVDTERRSRSRLMVGTQLSREEMLHLALMSSENRAAHALGRQYPGGIDAFVDAMNRKAAQLGMSDTRYVEPTGLSSLNQSSARDLATLVRAAHQHQIIRELSTSSEYSVEIGNRPMAFRTTNALVRSPFWEIGLQKTGYISEAGRCLVMQASMAGRHVIMVFLDSAGKAARIGDAERVRRWIIETAAPLVPQLQTVPIAPPPLQQIMNPTLPPAPATITGIPRFTS